MRPRLLRISRLFTNALAFRGGDRAGEGAGAGSEPADIDMGLEPLLGRSFDGGVTEACRAAAILALAVGEPWSMPLRSLRNGAAGAGALVPSEACVDRGGDEPGDVRKTRCMPPGGPGAGSVAVARGTTAAAAAEALGLICR